jgi:hypothetical protein
VTVIAPEWENGMKRRGIRDGSGDHRDMERHTDTRTRTLAHSHTREKLDEKNGSYSAVSRCGWLWLARLCTIVTVTQDWFSPQPLLFVFFSCMLHEAGEGRKDACRGQRGARAWRWDDSE